MTLRKNSQFDRSQVVRRERKGHEICPSCRIVIVAGEPSTQCKRCGLYTHRLCSKASDGRCHARGCGAVLVHSVGPQISEEARANESRKRLIRGFKFGGLDSATWGCAIFLTVVFWIGAFFSSLPPNIKNRSQKKELYEKAWASGPKWPWKVAQALTVFLGLIAGVSNTAQALVLASASNPKGLRKSGYTGLVAFEGTPSFEGEPLKTSSGRACIYLREVEEVWEVDNKGRGRWESKRSEEFCIPFSIDEIMVGNEPTEIYGLATEKEVVKAGEYRRVSHYLSANTRITVFGRMSETWDGFVVRSDPILGMIFSTRGIQSTLLQELSKGLFSMGAAAICAWFLLKH